MPFEIVVADLQGAPGPVQDSPTCLRGTARGCPERRKLPLPWAAVSGGIRLAVVAEDRLARNAKGLEEQKAPEVEGPQQAGSQGCRRRAEGQSARAVGRRRRSQACSTAPGRLPARTSGRWQRKCSHLRAGIDRWEYDCRRRRTQPDAACSPAHTCPRVLDSGLSARRWVD